MPFPSDSGARLTSHIFETIRSPNPRQRRAPLIRSLRVCGLPLFKTDLLKNRTSSGGRQHLALKRTIAIVGAIIALLHFGRFSSTNYKIIAENEIVGNLLSNAGKQGKRGKRMCSEPDMARLKEYTHDLTLFDGLPKPHKESHEVIAQRSKILPGGIWSPDNCNARYSALIIIPYKDREEHLDIFLRLMHPFLQAQNLSYAIIVVEQSESVGRAKATFNRAKLFNVGFIEGFKNNIEGEIGCAIFHDVDLIPMDGRNIYACITADRPRHLTANIDIYRYNLMYEQQAGGAISVTSTLFQLLNGFSNSFYGWGGEDDNFSRDRLTPSGQEIVRFDSDVSRYRALKHKTNRGNQSQIERNHNRISKGGDIDRRKDGIRDAIYIIRSDERRPLYRHLLVDL